MGAVGFNQLCDEVIVIGYGEVIEGGVECRFVIAGVELAP